MANNAEPARVAVIGLDYWGPNLVRNFAAAYCKAPILCTIF